MLRAIFNIVLQNANLLQGMLGRKKKSYLARQKKDIHTPIDIWQQQHYEAELMDFMLIKQHTETESYRRRVELLMSAARKERNK